MAYDEALAERVRQCLTGLEGLGERKMFGGLCFTFHGNMCCGVVGDELMVRVGPGAYEKALAQKHAREMDFTGRPLKGMIYIETDGLRTKRNLAAWVKRGIDFAGSLPAK